MQTPGNAGKKIWDDGYEIIEKVYTGEEVDNLLRTILQADPSGPAFRKTNDLFAIRRFFKEVPAAIDPIFNTRLRHILSGLWGDGYFVVKSIYFDKPAGSNWFVSYHQDLTISVDKREEIEGFGPWTIKGNQFGVQPPLDVLQDNFTVRIHLDDTQEENGALSVVPGSHRKGLYRPETIDWAVEREATCSVGKGGIMLMKPLLLHASGRTTNQKARRVIHLEFSRSPLPGNLQWAERM